MLRNCGADSATDEHGFSQIRKIHSSRSVFHPCESVATIHSCLFDMFRSDRSLDFQAVGQYPVHVKSITYSAARENLASTINRVCEDQAPIVITRNRDQAVVMLSLAEYESLQETAYLLRSPANARRLLDSLDAAKRGKVIRKKLKLGA